MKLCKLSKFDTRSKVADVKLFISMKRIPSLDGLRAISVSLVLIGHLAHSHGVPQFLSTYANSGVRMFFIISGYLITTLLQKEHTQTSTICLRQFYLRRAYRILPAAGVFMLFAWVVYWRELRWFDIAAMLLYLVDFDGAKPWMIGHLWSLGVEEQFYLLWPSLLKKFYRQKVVLLLGVVLMSPVYMAICFRFKVPGGGYGSLFGVADNLAVGCLLAIFGSRIPKIHFLVALTMLLAVILIPHFPAITPARTLLELFVLWPVMNCSMAGLLLHVVQTPYRFLNIAPVVWLGKISYSLYLWQQPFFFAPPGQPAYKLLFGIALACLSYYLVEQSFLKLREKMQKIDTPKLSLIGSSVQLPEAVLEEGRT